MADENLINESGEAVDNSDYIAAINQLKQNTVDRQKYDKLKAENKMLLDSIVNGQEIEVAKEKPKADIGELRKKLFTQDLTNLDYAKTTLELRNTLIQNGEQDPFLPFGHTVQPTQNDIDEANRLADVLQYCVDYADGNADVFTDEFKRHIY